MDRAVALGEATWIGRPAAIDGGTLGPDQIEMVISGLEPFARRVLDDRDQAVRVRLEAAAVAPGRSKLPLHVEA